MGINFIAPEGVYTSPAKLTTKSITENGTYSALDDNANGYSQVTVNVEGGGGGETWETVFEGNVTTIETPQGGVETLEGYSISADTIKVTFNGTEYECNKETSGENAYFGDMAFSEYPFAIALGETSIGFLTQNAGTYTLKIEEPQSGGSSDFSTAEVTVINNTPGEGYINGAFTLETPACTLYNTFYEANKTKTEKLVLYKGGAVIEAQGIVPSISGNIESLGDHMYSVTGDCTITIS